MQPNTEKRNRETTELENKEYKDEIVANNVILSNSSSQKKKYRLKSKCMAASNNKVENFKSPEGLSILASAASNLEEQQNEERLIYLKTHMPANMISSINTRDMNSLKLLIEDTFLPDCQLRTSAVPNEVIGRENVYRFFETYIQGCPDVVMEYITPMQFNTRVISFICAEQGTRSNFNVPDQLFDHLNHGTERAPFLLYEKNKYCYLRSSGTPIPFTGISYVNFILNEAMTHVEKYVHTCKEIKVADSTV